MEESLAGRLLLSSPALADPNFRRTIVLITHHDDEGAAGLVLSRPSELAIAEALPDLGPLPYADQVVFLGGPVQPEAVVVLVELAEPDAEVEPILGQVAYLPPERSEQELALRRARVFAGYSGWGTGQLEAELAESAWIVVDADAEDVFAPDPDALWRTVVQRMGGRFSELATMPYDPRLN